VAVRPSYCPFDWKIPFLTRPSWPKKLVVPDGLDLKRNPEAFFADHVIVARL